MSCRAGVQDDVERSVRDQLYGERPAVDVGPRRRARVGRREPAHLGRLVGERYRLLGRIGAGGMATVYRARDVRLARDVAVKIIAERFAREPLFVRQFRREAELCARLSHPNIVTVLDAGVVPRDFIVMELVEGMDAGALLKRHGPPTAGETAHLVVQTCEALAHSHDHGVIHQDVSPHNILIRWPDAAVKLADFGLASDCLNPTARRETGGTPGYIAPEVLGGESPSPRSDLYSLGVVAYRLFAGSTPAGPDDPEPTAPHVAREAGPRSAGRSLSTSSACAERSGPASHDRRAGCAPGVGRGVPCRADPGPEGAGRATATARARQQGDSRRAAERRVASRSGSASSTRKDM